jgi:hypothetical protein
MINLTYKGESAIIKIDRYTNNRMRLELRDEKDGEPIATITVNVPQLNLSYNEAVIKSSSENLGMIEWMKEQRLVVEVLGNWQSGFCSYPIVKLNMPKLRLLAGEIETR